MEYGSSCRLTPRFKGTGPIGDGCNGNDIVGEASSEARANT